MAIAPQSAMPQRLPTTRPEPYARLSGAGRHSVLSPAPEPRVAGVVTRIVALMVTTAFALGAATAVTLVIVTGAITQLGRR
jgi:hypothetical protein